MSAVLVSVAGVAATAGFLCGILSLLQKYVHPGIKSYGESGGSGDNIGGADQPGVVGKDAGLSTTSARVGS